MSPWISLGMALRGINSNRLRAALTTLGIVIGVASVIVMLALGNGARVAVEQNFSYLGADTIMLSTSYSGKENQTKPLTYEDGLAIQDLDSVRLVEMSITTSGKIRSGRNVLEMGVNGVSEQGIQSLVNGKTVQPVDWKEGKRLTAADLLESGRFFSRTDVDEHAQVCILGADTAQDLFEGDDPLGQTVWVGRTPCTVVGVLVALETVDPSQRYKTTNPNEAFYLPISTVVQKFYKDVPSVNMSVHVKDVEQIDAARKAIGDLLRQRHAIEKDEKGAYTDDFEMTTRKEVLGAQQEAARTFSLLLAAMAIVSLVVGGIGIVNVMLVSVSERTSEIGIRLAVGAQPGDIVVQFLLESVLISAVGGVIGLVAGIFMVPLAATLNQGVAVLSPGSLPLAFGVALLTGVVFGLYPAARASRLNPIEALRHE
jgi:putative ABC transport system permease protein